MVSFLKGRDRLTVVIGNKSTTLPVNDARVAKIMELIGNVNKGDMFAENELEEMLFPVNQVIKLSDNRFTWDGRSLKLVGSDVAMPEALAERIMEFIEKKYPLEAFINFWKNLIKNPTEGSKQSLYDFIERHGITITNSGYMVLYKGVMAASNYRKSSLIAGTAGYYRDKEGKARRPNGSFASKAEIDQYLKTGGKSDTSQAKFVDIHSGTFDNSPGLVVSMPRDKVDADRNVGCSRGLHVGSYEYASTFGPVTLKVLVNPEDVVSVPFDCECQKIRVSKYFVSEVISEKFEGVYDDIDFAFIQTNDLINCTPYLGFMLQVDEEV